MLSPTSTSAMSIGEDLERGAGVEAALQHDLGDAVGVLEHRHVVLRRADGGDDALADPGDDGLFGGAADEAIEIGAHRDPRLHLELDAVAGDAVDGIPRHLPRGYVDDLRVDRGADRLLHVAPGQVDRAGAVVVEHDVGLVRRDERLHHARDVAAREEVGFELVAEMLMPAFFAVIRIVTMTDGFTLRKRMKMIWSRLTGALERIDCHHSQNALQMNPKIRIAMMPMMNRMMRSKDMPFYLLVSCGAPSVASATTTLIAPIRTTTFGLPIRIATMAMMNRPMEHEGHVALYLRGLMVRRPPPGATNTMGPSMCSTTTFAPRPRLPLCTCTSALPAVETRPPRWPRRRHHDTGGAGMHADLLGVVMIARFGGDLALRDEPA